MTVIAIIDDDQSIREGMTLVLENPLRTVVTYPDGENFLSSLQNSMPDIAFIDLKMPGKSGLDVLRETQARAFLKVMISAHGDVATAVQAIKLGAANFIEKPFTPEELEDVITDIQTPPNPIEAFPDLAKLTPREGEVARALNRGLSNKEIAIELELSPRTVEIHRARVFHKLEVRNLAGLVRLMTKAGLD